MQDERTPNLNLPLPSDNNYLYQDLPRLREAFSIIDDFAREIRELSGGENQPNSGNQSGAIADTFGGTEESWTGGYWPDDSGRKAYSKWITVQCAGVTTSQTFQHGIPDVAEIFVAHAYIAQATGVSLPVPFSAATVANSITDQVNDTTFTWQTNGTARPGTLRALLIYCCKNR
ncbi:MAG: hypothetical protein LBH14_02320 [Desulfobulbaceae bacterium]|jgi:hypothetical protein|nr:hypothetical protein [Desulfobulbaceae bacterium]